MLTLVNQMFKVYFKINRHQLCKPLMRAIDSCNLKDKFALAQIITYKFFAGLKAMFDGDFRTANECLSFAFLKCHKNSTKNKRSILLYLVPVKMILVSAYVTCFFNKISQKFEFQLLIIFYLSRDTCQKNHCWKNII